MASNRSASSRFEKVPSLEACSEEGGAVAAGALSGRLRPSVFQGYHFSCVYPDLVLRAIKHIFLDILILPLGNLLPRTYR